MLKALFTATALTCLCLSGAASAQTMGDDEMVWTSDRDDDYFYLAYAVPESDRFAIAFICAPRNKKVYFALNEKQGGTVKVGDRFALTLQAGDRKTSAKGETSFDANEDMLRSIAPLKANDPFVRALARAPALQLTRGDKTTTYPLTDIEPRLREFQKGCRLRK